jgi:hypothetical protein
MTTWHAAPDVLVRYATEPDALADASASSLEQHLIACPHCRAGVAAAAAGDEHATAWAAIADVIDRPRQSASERVVRWLGVTPGVARLVAGTRALRTAWAVAVVGLAALAALLARAGASDGPFLVLAPIVPLTAVVVSFLPVSEPSGEAGTASPLHGAGLAARRVVAVVVPALAVVAAFSTFAPGVGAGAPLWLLPGLALALGSLALATFVRVTIAAGALTALWIALLATTAGVPRSGLAVDDVAVFHAAGQVACLCAAVLAATVVYFRRSRFGTLEVTW